MNSPQPVPGLAAPGGSAPDRAWTRHLVNVLVALVVIVVAGAAFVFSYDGVHAIALLGGVSAQLARYYPGLFDAVLVVACVTAVMLRDGRWWARLWAWLVIIVVLAAIGTTDVLHAMDYTLRHRPTQGIVAAAPVVAVLLAFSLLVTLLRQPGPSAPPDLADGPARIPEDYAPPIALPAAAVVVTAPPAITDAVSVELVDVPVSDVAPTRPEPTLAEIPAVPVDAVPGDAEPEDTAPRDTAPGDAAPRDTAPGSDQSATPTVEVPALALARPSSRSQNIRYAGSVARGAPAKVDYWDTEDSGELGGLVYPARDETPAGAGGEAEPGATPAAEPAAGKTPPEIAHDAAPFTPDRFGPVPRLNRVRSTPTPPADEDE